MTFGLAFTSFGELGAFPILGDSVGLSATSILAGSANGTTLGTASIVGPFTGTPTWSLTDPSGTFQINSSTGVVTVLSNTQLTGGNTLPITISVSGTTPVPVAGHFVVTVTASTFLESNFASPSNEPWVFW